MSDNNLDEHADEHGDEEYLIAHTTLTFLIDQSGQIVMAFPYATLPDQIVVDMGLFLE